MADAPKTPEPLCPLCCGTGSIAFADDPCAPPHFQKCSLCKGTGGDPVRARDREIAAALRAFAETCRKSLFELPCIAIGREEVAVRMAVFRELADALVAGTLTPGGT